MSSAKIPPKPAKDVVYVDVDDEITGIIDKVENSEQKVVALVLPKRAASLQSIVNMKLLKRSAEQADKNVVLITNENALLPLAGAAGLHVAKNLQSKPDIPAAPGAAAAASLADDETDITDATEEDEADMPAKFDYNRPVGALAAAHEAENPETIDLDDEDEPVPAPTKAPKGSKVKVPNFDRFRMMLGLGALALVALIVFIIFALFVLPKATITIKTSSEPVSATFNLTASPAAKAYDSVKGILPAKLESTDQTASQQVTATGQQNNGDKATGTITMTAQKCSGNPFDVPSSVPAGTGVSSGGVTYITQGSTSFHGTGTNGSCYTYSADSSTDITANSAGSKYNVSGADFSVAGRSDVSASGSASGGTDNIVTVLSQSDVDAVKAKLNGGTASTDFSKSFIQKLQSQGEYVLSSTLKQTDPQINANPAVGQPASTASVSVKITYTVLTIQKSDLSQAIQDKLAGQIDKSKQRLTGNFLNDADVTVQNYSAANVATLSVDESTTAVPIISTDAVKKQAEGKKTGDIQAALNNWAGVKSVDVKLSPFWVSKAPKKPAKITVILQEVKNSSNNSAP